jgi:hypothetical protein
MGQPAKRKRKPKHRGNAAGMIETRARTGRKPTDAERKRDVKAGSAARRIERMNRPPTWRAAVTKAGLAAVVFALAVTLLFRRPLVGALALGAFTFLIYVPLSYYTDTLVYKRRSRRPQRQP